ncbi:MAG: hypothetical protein EBS77_05390 [Gammaproteobacteria bacterium]|nr:hypothetical protein [Gammaproteobacteria bacterium]
MFELVHGLGNIICVLSLFMFAIGLINPKFTKQENRQGVIRVSALAFLTGFILVAVGAYYGGMLSG